MPFDYYYGGQSESFAFYRIPRILVTGQEFRCLSTDAKLLYGLMLDRMGLSMRNGWYDAQGRVFIYYTMEQIQVDMNCGHDKALKLLAELDAAKGVGLIERVKQGQGKPTIIYVKQFTAPEVPAPAPDEDDDAEGRGADMGKAHVKTSDIPMSRPRKIRGQDFDFSEANKNNINKTDMSNTDPSIYPSYPDPGGSMDGYERAGVGFLHGSGGAFGADTLASMPFGSTNGLVRGRSP